MGIAMSSGVIRDFAGPFYVSVRILDPTVPSSNHYMYISLIKRKHKQKHKPHV